MVSNKILYKIGVFALGSMLFSCNNDSEQKIEKPNYQLVWADEFNGVAGSQPDATKWTYDIGRGNNGWGNNEAQFYTNRPQNVAMDGNGNLVITAIRETFQGASYTSARIKTKNLFEQGYGRFEARLKTPYGQGLWPAFWMLGNNIDQVGWPFCGEIDIMELRGQKPNIASCALHGPGYSGGNAILQEYTLFNGRFDNQYHVFAVEWHADRLDFYIDNLMYRRIEKSEVLQAGQWVYDHPFFMILNVAVGGSFPGPPNASTPFPQKMTIDYVRVYK